MLTHSFHMASPSGWQQIERELLDEIRRAESAFKLASAEQKDEAGQRYQCALEQFCRRVLDSRFAPMASVWH